MIPPLCLWHFVGCVGEKRWWFAPGAEGPALSRAQMLGVMALSSSWFPLDLLRKCFMKQMETKYDQLVNLYGPSSFIIQKKHMSLPHGLFASTRKIQRLIKTVLSVKLERLIISFVFCFFHFILFDIFS